MSHIKKTTRSIRLRCSFNHNIIPNNKINNKTKSSKTVKIVDKIVNTHCRVPNPLYNVEDKEKFNHDKLNIPIPIDLIEQLENSTLIITEKYKPKRTSYIKTKNNHELQILQAIKTISNDTSVILINTDKNLGPALVYTQWYNESMLETLSVANN